MLASGINCFKINLDTTSAVNKLNNTPSASTSPNPLTIPEPKKYSVNATINVVTFPSIIVLIAFLKLFSKAFPDATFFASSSFNLSNIITFASTAIPIDRIKPAIPESVNDIPVFEITNNNIETYIIKAIDATIPGNLYITSIIKQITTNATIPALILTSSACCPTYGPIYSLFTIFKLNGKLPESISIAYSSAISFFSA